MARFKIGTAGAAPLQIQIGTPATQIIEITRVSACGENTSGSASRPQLTRPTSPGTGTGTIVSLSPSDSSVCTGITSFSVAPATPSASTGSFNLPIRMNIRTPRGCGFIIGISSYGLLYAKATGGHTWQGELEFEEL